MLMFMSFIINTTADEEKVGQKKLSHNTMAPCIDVDIGHL